jgi:hypothetical protein
LDDENTRKDEQEMGDDVVKAAATIGRRVQVQAFEP